MFKKVTVAVEISMILGIKTPVIERGFVYLNEINECLLFGRKQSFQHE
jgi:hypothetical protein